jgi:hypothetical protein
VPGVYSDDCVKVGDALIEPTGEIIRQTALHESPDVITALPAQADGSTELG